ncbi:MAG: histone deacetylase [Acidobacteria bacterium]|nr:MAG: histone deacetylase [Acidobacteriota bacterium]GIK77020.1 MAG: histone deacetylase [Actinomycetes bacterium]
MALYLRHPTSLAHDTGPHPENAGRIEAIESALERAGWPGLERAEPPPAEREWLTRVHSARHVDSIARLCAAGGGPIDLDTVTVPASWEAALRAAGAAAEGARSLLAGEHDVAFCGMRPPGHHAESGRAMGFCLLNNAAVGAAHAVAACGAERVLVLDWDVHHGNGTEEIFRERGDVLYVSIHQSPLYPGTGAAAEIGSGAGAGATVNLPVPPGAGGAEFVGLVAHLVVPLAHAFRPDLLVVSAGYDAHAADPLAGCLLDDADYAAMAAHVRELGRGLAAPILVCLEGGYERGALARSVLATLGALNGDRPAPDVGPVPLVSEAVARVGSTDRWRGVL